MWIFPVILMYFVIATGISLGIYGDPPAKTKPEDHLRTAFRQGAKMAAIIYGIIVCACAGMACLVWFIVCIHGIAP